MRKTFLKVVCVFLIPTVVLSIAPTENAHGVIVKYRNANKTGYKTRDQLNQQMQTSLVYRPKRSPYDVVLPKSTDMQHDFKELAKLCEGFQKNPAVAECEINYDLFARNEAPAPASLEAPAPACELTQYNTAQALRDGALSPFWAQELSGLDLAAFPRNAAKMGVAVKVAVLDQGFGELPAALKSKFTASVMPSAQPTNHGAMTLGLLTGPIPYSIQAPLEISHLFEVRTTADYLRVMEALEDSKQTPTVIHISVGLGHTSNAVRDVMKRMAAKSLLVGAAANDWPSETERNEKEFPGMLVGSLSPEGYPTENSGVMSAVTISVPSDRYLVSTADGKTPAAFGGTSAASAIVASVVAAARSLVPDLTQEEIKEIFATTGMPTPAGRVGANGYAGLNAVQFLAVVDRIRSQGLAGKARDKSITAGSTGRLYQFEKEAEVELTRALPVMEDPAATCEARKMAYAQLRRAFFLQPSGKAAPALAKALMSQGLTSNARYVENMERKGMTAHLGEDIVSSDSSVRVGAARVAGWMGIDGIDLVMKFAEMNSRNPASEGAAAISTQDAIHAIAASMPEDARNALNQRLRAAGGDLEKMAK